MRRVVIAGAALSIALAGAAFGGGGQDDAPKVPVDDVNPRAPTTLLDIKLEPYYCMACAKDKPATGEAPVIMMERKPVEAIAKQLDLKSDEWIAMTTPHFKIFSTLEDSTAKFDDSVFCRFDLERLKKIQPKLTFSPEGAKLDRHQRLHMYHIRLERQYAHFSALTNNQLPNLGMPEPYEIYLFADYGQHHNFCDRYIGNRQDKGGMQHHERDAPNFILFSCAESIVASQTAKGDGPLANHVFHNVAHCLIDGYNNYFRETPAWIEEGLGHYYERRENPRWNNFCWAEGRMPADFLKPDWKTTIFSLVRRGRDTPFAQWCEKLQPGELSGVENGFTWGVVKWLIDNEPVRFTKMIEPMDDLAKNLSCAQMIQEGFDVSPSVLYQRWRAYVLENWAGR